MTNRRKTQTTSRSAQGDADPRVTPLDELLITGRLCTPDEVAEMLRVSTRTLADWRTGRATGHALPFVRIGGRVMYLLRDVNAYLLQRVEAAAMRRDADA
ncbi:helix-turn-helix domain-containing protein [uncultured Nocardioides sp.]|uniref:helix-turn-helix domain-containing protein n=1 Tax=uncultured Nocardioides sp. TaxID=198441 RepID=UPI0026305A83|nr:helix-turn-helix domain-containing protein [uncultured Nocardioides sp.]